MSATANLAFATIDGTSDVYHKMCLDLFTNTANSCERVKTVPVDATDLATFDEDAADAYLRRNGYRRTTPWDHTSAKAAHARVKAL